MADFQDTDRSSLTLPLCRRGPYFQTDTLPLNPLSTLTRRFAYNSCKRFSSCLPRVVQTPATSSPALDILKRVCLELGLQKDAEMLERNHDVREVAACGVR